jgi:hypothetical protein
LLYAHRMTVLNAAAACFRAWREIRQLPVENCLIRRVARQRVLVFYAQILVLALEDNLERNENLKSE